MSAGRSLAMDHTQTTEFGSKQFHDKIHQQHHHSSHNSNSTKSIPLPIRTLPTSEPDTTKPAEKKPGLINWKGIVRTIRPSSKPSSQTTTNDLSITDHRTSIDSTRQSVPLDHHVQALPTELQIHVISYLPLKDILNLRLTSKLFHSIVTSNEAPIVRHHIDSQIPAYAQRLYPIGDSTELNFHYLCSLWHRLHVAAKLSFLMCEWVTKDIFLRETEAQRKAFAAQHERMRRRLIPLLFTVFHFFETHRKLHLERLVEFGGLGLKQAPYTVNPIEKKIMDMYDDQTLLRVHEVFPLVISSFCRRLRPPTYVGRVERSLRGYMREKPSDDIHVAILCLGGLRQVERLWEIKGYNSRRSAVDHWYNGLTKESQQTEPATKSKRSLMSFGRKKSNADARDNHHREPNRSSFSSLHGGKSPAPSINESDYGDNWVFNTSMSAGAPMSNLDVAQTKQILCDLPVLQQIWMQTAEALILERKVVQRTNDIKRNQQVMLDLIREDGIDEEDEWWYGQRMPASIRPPENALEGDDME